MYCNQVRLKHQLFVAIKINLNALMKSLNKKIPLFKV